MFCSQCGKENSDDAKYCGSCGAPLSNDAGQTKEQGQTIKQSQTFWDFLLKEIERLGETGYKEQERVTLPKDSQCPYCGGTDTHLVSRNTTNIKKSGYDLGNACCGTCLLGPFGLLCGFFGRDTNVKISDETWWICPACGQQHITRASALEKVKVFSDAIIGNMALAGFVASMIFFWGFERSMFGFLLMLVIAIGAPLFLSYKNYDILSKELGYSLSLILPPEMRKKYLFAILKGMGTFMAVGLLAVPFLELFAE